MDESRKQKIIGILKQNETDSVPFARAKNQLLEDGYKESEIVAALYEFPYDSKAKPVNKVLRYYEAHPADADKVAKSVLDDLEEQDRQEAITYGAAAMVAGRINDYNADAYYSSRFLDAVGGLSYLALVAIVAVVMGIGIKTNHTHEAYAALVIGLSAYSLFFGLD